jgi:hypothetical protein
MAAITDLSDLINKLTSGNNGTPQNIWFHKQARVSGAAAPATIAGRPSSLWGYDGQPGPGAMTSTNPNIPTNLSFGALGQNNPGGTRQQWLTQTWASGLVAGTLMLYDRLFWQSNLSGTTTTAQTAQGAGTTPLTRYTDGIGNIAWVEIYSQIGTSTTSVTASYTNQAGTSGKTTTAVTIGGTGFREQTRVIMLPLQTGDTGVQNVNTMTVLTSTGTAGLIGITVAHPLALMTIGQAGGSGWRDFTTGLPGIPEIKTSACLSLLWFPSTTTSPEIFGGLSLVEA